MRRLINPGARSRVVQLQAQLGDGTESESVFVDHGVIYKYGISSSNLFHSAKEGKVSLGSDRVFLFFSMTRDNVRDDT